MNEMLRCENPAPGGDSMDFLELGGAVSGGFAQIAFPRLALGFQADAEAVDGRLRLIARNDAMAGVDPTDQGRKRQPPAAARGLSAGPGGPSAVRLAW